jgi:hypothetical protein
MPRSDGYVACYEYYDKAGPMAVNGYPTFFSCGFLTADERTKVIEYHKTAKTALDGALAP